jgi:hypothetical protein
VFLFGCVSLKLFLINENVFKKMPDPETSQNNEVTCLAKRTCTLNIGIPDPST